MIIFEDFIVEVPSTSGFVVGDIVEVNTNLSFQQGFALQSGLVVRVYTDPGQELLPLFFVVGQQTHVRSQLSLGTLQISGRLKAKL